MAEQTGVADDRSVIRCAWCGDDPMLIAYHDREWGVPAADDYYLFEKLLLDGAQAGLSWRTILYKRENYRRAFDGFDPEAIARYTQKDIERLLADAGIVRNRAKIESAIGNARGFLAIVEEEGSFGDFLWQYVDYAPVQNERSDKEEVPAWTETSRRMSRDLKKHGFRFVGPTICYAFMQAVGMVNDHLTTCFRYTEVRAMAETHDCTRDTERR